MKPEPANIRVLQPGRGWTSLQLRELWDYRGLLYFLTWRDVRVRYKQTVLGALWAILQPFLAMVVFTVFFHRLAGIAPDGKVPYALWSYAGLLPWTYFSQAITRSGTSLVGNQNLLTKVYFPRLVIPISAVLAGLVDLAAAFAVFLFLMLFYGAAPGLHCLWLPAMLLLTMGAALGAGLWLSAWNVRYRDVQYVLPFLVQIGLFVSPVVYPSSRIPEAWRVIYGLNPMAGAIEGFRWCLLGTGPAPGPVFWASVGVTAALLVTGGYYFRRMERTFADEV